MTQTLKLIRPEEIEIITKQIVDGLERTARAHWYAGFKEGMGTVSTQSGILDKAKYNFKTRFDEEEFGTNPEELLAAAHASCFSMSLAAILANKGMKGIDINTVAFVTMSGLNITHAHLSVKARVSGINKEMFSIVVKDAKRRCMISKILKIPVTIEEELLP